jgi:polyhydroxyalkanoate synthesis regulator phasin
VDGELSQGTLLGLVAAVVAVAHIGMQLAHKFVSHLLEEKRKNSKDRKSWPSRAGPTVDLAVQGRALEGLQDDVDALQTEVRKIEGAVSKDLPHQMDLLNSKADLTRSDIRELKDPLDRLRTSLDGNTAATKALYDLLAAQIKSRR